MKKKEILEAIENDILEENKDTSTVPEGVTTIATTTTTTKTPEPEKEIDKLDLSKLKEMKVGQETINKLPTIGISNMADLSIANATALHEKLASQKYSREFCSDLIVFANNYLIKSGVLQKAIQTCRNMKNERPPRHLSTGDENIDKWFNGGIPTRAVTEFYGRFRSGKTQICYSTATYTASIGKKVLYIDTENTFNPARVDEICEARGYDVDTVEDNILVMKPQTASLLTKYAELLGNYIREYDIELVIVDSIIALHRAEFAGRGNLADRQQDLGKIISLLTKFATARDIAVMITNQVLDSPDPYKSGTFATGGNILGHGSTHRIYMKVSGGSTNASGNISNISTMLMEDSPTYARTELTIQLGQFGVRWIDPSKKIPDPNKPLPKDYFSKEDN